MAAVLIFIMRDKFPGTVLPTLNCHSNGLPSLMAAGLTLLSRPVQFSSAIREGFMGDNWIYYIIEGSLQRSIARVL